MSVIVLLLVCAVLCTSVQCFGLSSKSIVSSPRMMTMEYIPDGLTKAQWKAIKQKEEEEKKKRANGSLGTSRFKSRSFEAWQKAGGKHLFPVDPTTTPYEERPYMQRKDGDWEGQDLQNIGLQGKGQGAASRRLALDDMYEKAKKEGKLDSISIFGGAALPWTSEAVSKLSAVNDVSKLAKGTPKGIAGKKLSPEELERAKKNLVKPVFKQTAKKETVSEEPKKKKGLFGLF